MSYITLAQVRAYLKLGAAETADDAFLTDLAARAQSLIDAHCQRTFEASADVTHYLDARADVDGPTLWLRAEFCQLTSVTNGDGSVVTPSQYVTEPRNTMPYYALRLKAATGLVWTYDTSPENALAVVGRRAFALTAPDVVAQACLRLTAWLYRQKDTSADVDRPLLTDAGVTILPMALPKDVQQMLLPYRRLGLA